MNTPNPNPSPELRELIDILKAATEADGLTIYEHSAAEIGLAVMDCRADLLAALTPTTPAETVTVALPGAGGVERHHLVERLIDIATKEDGVGMSYEAPTYRGPNGARLNLYGKRASAAYWLLSHGKEIAALLQAPTLATVAAADDEGVAVTAIEALEGIIEHAETRIKDGKELGGWVWRIALEDIARDARAAIRLLSQGGGKA